MKTNLKFFALVAFAALCFNATVASAGPALKQDDLGPCRERVTKENCMKQRLSSGSVLKAALNSVQGKVTGTPSIHLIGQMGDGDSIMSRYLMIVPVKAESFENKLLFTVEVEETVRDDGDKVTVIQTFVQSIKEVRL